MLKINNNFKGKPRKISSMSMGSGSDFEILVYFSSTDIDHVTSLQVTKNG